MPVNHRSLEGFWRCCGDLVKCLWPSCCRLCNQRSIAESKQASACCHRHRVCVSVNVCVWSLAQSRFIHMMTPLTPPAAWLAACRAEQQAPSGGRMWNRDVYVKLIPDETFLSLQEGQRSRSDTGQHWWWSVGVSLSAFLTSFLLLFSSFLNVRICCFFGGFGPFVGQKTRHEDVILSCGKS